MPTHTAPLPERLTAAQFQHGFSTHWMDVDRGPADWFVDVVGEALSAGHRRIDCNPRWDTETMVGVAIARSGIPRDDLYVTTVVPFSQLGRHATRESVTASLARLGLDRLDLVLVSAPASGWDVEGTAAALDELVERGVVGSAGAGYMSLPDLDAFTARLSSPLAAHLTEMHPLWPASELHRHAVEHGYWIIADGPFMQGMVREVREVRAAAARADATPWQITLAWLHGRPNVASSTWTHDPEQMRSNLAAAGLELDPAAVASVDGIERRWSGVPHLHPVDRR